MDSPIPRPLLQSSIRITLTLIAQENWKEKKIICLQLSTSLRNVLDYSLSTSFSFEASSTTWLLAAGGQDICIYLELFHRLQEAVIK